MAALAAIIFLLVPYTSVAIDEEVESEITLQCDYCEKLAQQLINIKEEIDAAKVGCEIYQRPLDCLRLPGLKNEFRRLLWLWGHNCEGDPPVTIPFSFELGATVVNAAQANGVTKVTSTTSSSSGCNCPCGQINN